MSIKSFTPFGYEGVIGTVEVDLRKGIPAVDIVGIADTVLKDSRTKVIEAIKNSGFEFPQKRVLISCSPADVSRKERSIDLAIALAILAESEQEKMLHSQDEDVLVIGELEEDGKVRGCRGITAALQCAVALGIKYAIIPEEVDIEAIPDGILVVRVGDLREAFNSLCHVDDDETAEAYEEMSERQKKLENLKQKKKLNIKFQDAEDEHTLDGIKEHNGLKYAMAVAVAGRHHILAYGRPGCGKTLILSHMPELLPNLLEEEEHVVQRIYSLAGFESRDIKARPFRQPHQTATLEGTCGGGVDCKPGEISLAHNGVLFLDEATEFRTSVLQVLRIPLENNNITLSRAGRHTTYPASFQLAMAMNPCPCGCYGSEKVCVCSPRTLEQYWRKVSGPLLVVFGIRLDCNKEDNEKFLSLKELRAMIEKAWTVQYERQGKLNEKLKPEEIAEYVNISEDSKKLLDKYQLRTTLEILKVARTLADIKQDEPDNFVPDTYVTEALELHGEVPYESDF